MSSIYLIKLIETAAQILPLFAGLYGGLEMTWYRIKNILRSEHSQINSIVALTKQYPKQWRKAQSWSSKALFHILAEGDGAENWVKPQTDTIKVTTNATTFSEQSSYGFRLVARDSNGELILAKSRCYHGSVSSDYAKVMAI